MEFKEILRQVLMQMYHSSLQNVAGLEKADIIVHNAISKEVYDDEKSKAFKNCESGSVG